MAGKEELRLLGVLLSPFAVRVSMALSMKGVSYEYVEEDLSNKSELLLKSNPVHKKVPVLIHNGKPVCESLIIVQYVDEQFVGGPCILPADPYERSIARFWATYFDDKLFPEFYGLVKAKTVDEREEKMTGTFAAIGQLEGAFAKYYKGKAFFGGDTIGYLDIVLGSCLFWFEGVRRVYGVEIISSTKTPLLAAWAERFGKSAVAKEMPDADKVVQYVNNLHATAAE